MKFLIFFCVLILLGCSGNTIIDGTVVGENELDPSFTQRVLFNVPNGISYTIQDRSGELYLVVVVNGADPLNEGDKGTFTLGDKLFSGTVDKYIDGERKTTNVAAYVLDKYELDKSYID